MNTMEWLDELNRRARHDAWHQTRLAEVRALEPAFLAIRSTLTEARQEQLDAYLSACEELEHSLTILAYELGREHRKSIVIPPAEG